MRQKGLTSIQRLKKCSGNADDNVDNNAGVVVYEKALVRNEENVKFLKKRFLDVIIHEKGTY